MRSLALRQAEGNRQAEAAIWNNIGNVNFHIEDYPAALEAHRNSLSIKESLNDRSGVAISLNNIGNVYKHTGEFESALNHYFLSLNLCLELGNRYGQAGALGNIGSTYTELKRPREAKEYHFKSLAAEREIGNRHGEAESLLQIAELYNRYPETAGPEGSLEFLMGCLSLSEEIQAKELCFRAHRALSTCYEARGEFDQALAHFRRSYDIERDIFNEQLSEKTKTLQIIHQVEVARLKNVELEEANRFKTRLLSIAAHDLRSPLSGIGGFAELLEAQLEAGSSSAELAEQIRLSANQMERLLSQLLESSIIEGGKLLLDLQSIDLSKVAGQVLDMHRQRAQAKGQELMLEVSSSRQARADELRMIQVLDNLVSNAIKFSPRGKAIRILIASPDERVRCSIQDEGPGLTAEDYRRLFGRFERLSARPTGGETTTGLGLSIAKQLVELQGGRIWAESAGAGLGTSFIVELPAS
ncbi:MAG: Alkaline phosphatase synthesis sensor protein PhoR [Nitrospira sp.]|nr:Alkaline phosphatase synthesis sensor protein PhoR [Nitrospira sp.]